MKSIAFVCALLLLLATLALPGSPSNSPARFVAAGSPPCNCYNGNIRYSAPRCVCTCNTDWLQPFCSFRATDTVRVEIWFDLDPSRFISDVAVRKLRDDLRPILLNSNTSTGATVDLSKIAFLYIKPSYNGKTLGLFDMPGGAVNWLWHYTWDVDNRTAAWPYADIRISAVFLTEEISEPDSFVDSLLRNTYFYNDHKRIVISLGDVIWLIGAILVVIWFPLSESIWSTNDEEMIQQDLAAGKLDPVYKPSKKYLE